jgi:branched-chain amino acid transport system ATP-binding protein
VLPRSGLLAENVVPSLSPAHRAYVLENGRVVMAGGGRRLVQDDRIRQAYVGL